MSLRSVVRGAVELAGTASGLAAVARRMNRRAVAVLAYHNVVRAEDAGRGDASLHLPLPRFREQLSRLERTHDIVDLETGLFGAAADRPRAVITFDDAYRGAVTLALPELARRGLPAVVFVAPGLLGSEGTWWDELAEAGLLSQESRQAALVERGGRGDVIMESVFGRTTPPALPASYGIATPDELRQHCSEAVTLGSHTWGHEHLPSLKEAELRESLGRTRAWLDEVDLPSIDWLALPYGAGSARVQRAAAECGHSHVLAIQGGVWRSPASGASDLVPRLNVPAGLSVRGLELRASGLKR